MMPLKSDANSPKDRCFNVTIVVHTEKIIMISHNISKIIQVLKIIQFHLQWNTPVKKSPSTVDRNIATASNGNDCAFIIEPAVGYIIVSELTLQE